MVEIADNGVGFDSFAKRKQAKTSATGFGLGVMHERADVAGGELTVISARGAGTRVIGRIPYTIPEAAIIEPPQNPMNSLPILLRLSSQPVFSWSTTMNWYAVAPGLW